MKPIILASASPRRAELLTKAAIPFQVLVSPTEEPEHKPAGIPVELWPMCLAWIKAAAVQKSLPKNAPDQLILAADTIVLLNNKTILNKPANRAHARRMLQSLAGKNHRVITGICLLSKTHHRLSSAQALCKVKPFTKARLDAYLDSNLWQGKAGAYGIQDAADPFVQLLEGDTTTVMGLPMPLIKRELASFTKDRK
jgi:septum formation protein